MNSAAHPPVRPDRAGKAERDAMVSRALLVLLLLTLPVAMVAIPPDPLWIHGIYDGGDYDDFLAISEPPSAGITPPVQGDLAPPQLTHERVFVGTVDVVSGGAVQSPAPRSPPPV
jgi:hypothetical protein